MLIEKILDTKLDAKRKAGFVGALGAIAGGGLMAVENNRAKKLQAERDAKEEARETKKLELMSSMLKPDGPSYYDQWKKDNPEPEPYKPDSSGFGTSSGSDSSSGATSDTTTPVSTFKPGAKLSQSQIQDLAVQVGFPSDVAPVISKIAMGESSGRSTAFNGKGADQSYGLMQINMLGDMGPERRKAFGLTSNEDLYDPLTNMKAAYEIYKTQGLEAWGAYTNGSYKKF